MTATKFLTASALALSLAAPATAQVVLQSYDVDGDGELTGAEFRNLFDNVATLATYDTDGDGYLSQGEYDAAFGDAEVHFAELGYTGFTYTDWDLNADGLVSEEEYAEGFLLTYDADASGVIEGEELQQIETDFGTDGVFGL
ncbi:hypothetical protein MWU52_05555 [Jannaschia sp. S6380]|uniref:hypothetical protein n=1 Tax=Jannaschia sp. S6380 TaxID=2926408 RepID=UPI001FF4513E|nr:hypothetical protein [Jannaschia sp. S6380]MCK0167012.1 hypothetical protein [Jannaschia sp. S6380]